MRYREKILFDFDWNFHLGEICYSDGIVIDYEQAGWIKSGAFKQGGPSETLDDSDWRILDLPHDFIVEGDFSESCQKQTFEHGIDSMRSDEDNQHTYHGSLVGGVAWYRKKFTIPESESDSRFVIRFDGVCRNCMVFLNGSFVGRNFSGSNTFEFDLTDFIHYGESNLLAVRVDATHYEGWYYEGGGIYRHVWLLKHDSLHVANEGGVFVTSSPDRELDPGSAKVKIQTKVYNYYSESQSFSLKQTILDHTGRQIAETELAAKMDFREENTFKQELQVNNPLVWSLDSPYLYTLRTEILKQGEIVDKIETAFGIRSIRFDASEGFFLNGKNVKIKGVCCHQDHAGLGVALPDRVHEFRIEKLKEMGCNAYRCAHNPPSPELLDICDRIGMLVLDENRYLSSAREYLDLLKSMILRDRNHPSIIVWIIGNEELLMQGRNEGRKIASTMVSIAHKLDPARLVTYANNNAGTWQISVSAEVDILGCNYVNSRYWKKANGGYNYLTDNDKKHNDIEVEWKDFYQEYHDQNPSKPIMITEAASTLTTRGVYEKNDKKCHLTAYDDNFPIWGCSAEAMWKEVAEKPYLAGVFVWTGFDYRGEPIPYRWPCVGSHFGIMDSCGFPKDNYYYYQSWWNIEKPILRLLPHWTWPGREGELIDIRCFSNCDEVELQLNGHCLSRKPMPVNGHIKWDVEYQSGVLKAIAFKGGKIVAEQTVCTTDDPFKIRMATDRNRIKADGRDVAIIRVEILDVNDNLVPNAENQISFSVDGEARIIGVGNGNPSSHEPDKADKRKTFSGLCQVIVQSARKPGWITLKASAENLQEATYKIEMV
jgi:beta-galactosidase